MKNLNLETQKIAWSRINILFNLKSNIRNDHLVIKVALRVSNLG